MSYSLDFRRHVLSVRLKEDLTYAETSDRFSVGIATLVRWSKRLEPSPAATRCRKINMDALRQDVENYPDAYQYERAARFGVAQNAIWYALRKLGVTYKKSPSSPEGGRRQTVCLPRGN